MVAGGAAAGTALVGADRDDAVDNDSGAAYAFSVPAGTAASCPDGGDTCPTKPPSNGSGDDGKAGSGDALTEWLSALKMDQVLSPSPGPSAPGSRALTPRTRRAV